jgi:ppGpp synthetase/RelA/SpoT-type nucleotidyltranferase
MSSILSKAAIDRAGKRLRDDAIPRPEDVAIYNEYRASLEPALREVAEVVSRWDPFTPHHVFSRLKRLDSVIDKLRRGHFRLSGINDIAGCRLIVDGIDRQNDAVNVLARQFPGCRITDYRTREHVSGYVAVHLNVRASAGHLVEIQVRTELQNRWAILSERLALMPHVGKGIKYGTGDAEILARLQHVSDIAAKFDAAQSARFSRAGSVSDGPAEAIEAALDREIDAILERADWLRGH